MRIPEPLFPFINRVMKLLLHSPLHGVMSGSIMVLHFTGRRSGKRRSTPVRYLREGAGRVFCLTGRETGWWHNFRAGAEVQLRIKGRTLRATAQALADDDAAKEAALRHMLSKFPSDAAYHGITLKRGQSPTDAQIRQAVARDVLVVFNLHMDE